MAGATPIRAFLAELERATIWHRPALPADPLASETPQDLQRRTIAEHDRRCGRIPRQSPTPDALRRATGGGDLERTARRKAVLEALRAAPATTPTELRDQLGTPLTTILRDIEALSRAGLVPARKARSQ
ncbi:helix-turn-helix domain-containing protein [Poseidonocella sp. HB161398]|uniref:helix-turn-helix domain-containing protein n=1 Tax=Poseidonocella sp. HB161398 TaxID=2320855 RepID=UPI001109AEF8|nr:helix-turn-helix domain-containing protein [Poseidonocella sp. HB161398]